MLQKLLESAQASVPYIPSAGINQRKKQILAQQQSTAHTSHGGGGMMMSQHQHMMSQQMSQQMSSQQHRGEREPPRGEEVNVSWSRKKQMAQSQALNGCTERGLWKRTEIAGGIVLLEKAEPEKKEMGRGGYVMCDGLC